MQVAGTPKTLSMALEVALAFRPTTKDLPLGSSYDGAFADQAMAAIEGGEASRTTEGVAGVGGRQLELDPAARIASAMADEGAVFRGVEARAI